MVVIRDQRPARSLRPGRQAKGNAEARHQLVRGSAWLGARLNDQSVAGIGRIGGCLGSAPVRQAPVRPLIIGRKRLAVEGPPHAEFGSQFPAELPAVGEVPLVVVPLHLSGDVRAALANAGEDLRRGTGARNQRVGQRVVGLHAGRYARRWSGCRRRLALQAVWSSTREGRTVRSVAGVFHLDVVAVEETCLQRVVAPDLRQVVLDGIEVFVVLVGSNVPERRFALVGAIRVESTPVAEEGIFLLE